MIPSPDDLKKMQEEAGVTPASAQSVQAPNFDLAGSLCVRLSPR